MHLHDSLESIAEQNAWLFRSVADKALLCGGLLLLSLALKPWPWALVVVSCATAAACAGARVSARSWLFSLRPLIAFACLGALPLIWIDPTRAAEVTLRALSAGSAVVLFVVTTPASEALAALQRFRVAAPLVELAYLSLRFAALLRDSAHSVSIAFRCRSGVRRRLQARFAMQATASIIARAFERGRRAEVGMSLRCGQEHLQFWTPSRESSMTFRASSAAICLLIAATAYLLKGQTAWR